MGQIWPLSPIYCYSFFLCTNIHMKFFHNFHFNQMPTILKFNIIKSTFSLHFHIFFFFTQNSLYSSSFSFREHWPIACTNKQFLSKNLVKIYKWSIKKMVIVQSVTVYFAFKKWLKNVNFWLNYNKKRHIWCHTSIIFTLYMFSLTRL